MAPQRTPWFERAFWSLHARSYDDFGGLDSPEVAVVIDAIEDLTHAQHLDVLDVGAGTGNYAIRLALAGHDVTAIDVADGMLSVLRAKARERNVVVETRRADVHDGIAAPAGSFDLVLCSYVLQVIRRPSELLADVRRVLRPGGCVVAVTRDPSVAATSSSPASSPLFNRLVWRVKRAAATRSAADRSPSRDELVELLVGEGFQLVSDVPDSRRIILIACRAD